MQTIQVIHDFVLSLDDGTKRAFKAGVHEVEDTVAGHWYVKAHSKPVEAAAAPAETPTPPPPAPPAAPEAPPPPKAPPTKAK